MNLVAVSFGVSGPAREIIKSIAANIFDTKAEILDLKVSELQTEPTDIVLLFGKKAADLFSAAHREKIELPDLKKLMPGNDDIRNQTYKDLLSFRDKINNSKVITKNTLPDLSYKDIESIESRLKEKNETCWKGKAKDGRSIEIQLIPTDSNADIVITFSELYALKMAIETLNIEQIVIS